MEDFDKEYEKAYQEYLKRVQEEKNIEEDDDSELDTGITALDTTYFFDKRVEQLIDAFDKAIAYIEIHTDLPKDEIQNRINQCISRIEFKEEYPENPNGIGYVDNIFHILSININILEENPEYIYEFVKHEITHMMSRRNRKKLI